MKVISIRQPWANLVVRGVKDVENRIWWTGYQGPLLIHASKNYDFEGQEWIVKNFPGVLFPGEIYQCGGIIGRVEMVGSVKEHPSPWFFGPFGHVYINAREIGFVPLRGRLGLFEVEIGQIGPIGRIL
jgi:hypothetical protein